MTDTGMPAAVISAFNPLPTFEDHLHAIAAQVPSVVVVDDSGRPGALAARLQLMGLENLHVVENDSNLGLAVALNRGIASAVSAGARRVVTFDQDTNVPAGFVAELAAAMDRLGPEALVVGPETISSERQPVCHLVGGEVCSLRILQSGMLVDARAFELVGMFREEFFIDVLEPDFLARLHRAGHHGFLALGVDLPHAVGETRRVNLGLVSPKVTDHAAFRRYLMTRNGIVVAFENVRTMPRFAADILAGVIREAARSILLESRRAKTLRAVLAGIADAIRRRLGPPPKAFRG